MVKRVLDLGYNVLWKEHPRAQRPFGNRLRQEFGGRLFTKKMNKLIPAEVFFTENKMAACISPHSTSLLLLSKFEIPVFQLTDFCDEFYNEAYRPVVGLVRKHVPPLQQLKPFRLEA